MGKKTKPRITPYIARSLRHGKNVSSQLPCRTARRYRNLRTMSKVERDQIVHRAVLEAVRKLSQKPKTYKRWVGRNRDSVPKRPTIVGYPEIASYLNQHWKALVKGAVGNRWIPKKTTVYKILNHNGPPNHRRQKETLKNTTSSQEQCAHAELYARLRGF